MPSCKSLGKCSSFPSCGLVTQPIWSFSSSPWSIQRHEPAQLCKATLIPSLCFSTFSPRGQPLKGVTTHPSRAGNSLLLTVTVIPSLPGSSWEQACNVSYAVKAIRCTLWAVVRFKRNPFVSIDFFPSIMVVPFLSPPTTLSLSGKWKVQLYVKWVLNQQAPCGGLGFLSPLQLQVCSIHYCS